jgi:hypothetical protein
MDISGNAFTLQCTDKTTCNSIITQQSGSGLYALATTDYTEAMIRCTVSDTNDPVLQVVIGIYNNTPIFTKSGKNFYNTIYTNKRMRVFNGMPNVLEFKVTTQRVYWDDDYGTEYYTGRPDDDVEEAYIIATWPEGTDYEVETGYYWKDALGNFVATPTSTISVVDGTATATITTPENTTKIVTMCTPRLQELFYPDLTFTATEIYKMNPHDPSIPRTQVYLPYLANDGLLPIDSKQRAKYNCKPLNCNA